ncbi:MAG TPA: class I SAM-dependent methyltransferase [Chroococcales cyanobacterium]
MNSLSNQTEPQIKETVDCLCCQSAEFEPVLGELRDTDGGEQLDEPFRSMTFQLVRCKSCRTVYLRERVTADQIGRFYSHEYHCYKPFAERGAIMQFLAMRLAQSKIKAIQSLLPKESNTVLDYGCGSGSWLELMKLARVPWHLIGSDIIESQVEMVKKLGVEAFVADEHNIAEKLAGRKVGLVHMNHVIEHLPDPIGTLAKLREVLVPGGVIYGQTPNIDSWDCRRFGKYWSQWHVPRHLVLYDPATLKLHAQKAGLDVIFVKSSLSSATNWANSILKESAMKAGQPYGLSSHPLYPALTIALLPLAVAESILGSTSNIDFALQRRS